MNGDHQAFAINNYNNADDTRADQLDTQAASPNTQHHVGHHQPPTTTPAQPKLPRLPHRANPPNPRRNPRVAV